MESIRSAVKAKSCHHLYNRLMQKLEPMSQREVLPDHAQAGHKACSMIRFTRMWCLIPELIQRRQDKLSPCPKQIAYSCGKQCRVSYSPWDSSEPVKLCAQDSGAQGSLDLQQHCLSLTSALHSALAPEQMMLAWGFSAPQSTVQSTNAVNHLDAFKTLTCTLSKTNFLTTESH